MEEEFPSYHVFISHRGPDVKKTLASLIYRDLKRLGLRVFFDKHELQPGDSLSPAIMTAISSASVHIAILSPTYAQSAWCLNELLWMLNCHGSAKFIPIFYDIQPSDLRYIHKGPYADAFHNHRTRGRIDISIVERWINALIEVSEISGLVYSHGKEDLGELLDSIVDRVLKEVEREPLDVAIHPVGLHHAAEDFQNEVLINQSEFADIMVVGIVGLSGSGKSTLVTHLYNSKRSKFRRSCFLSEIRKRDLPSLQQRLLTDLLGYPQRNIGDTRQGRSLLRDRLRGFSQALIVFDDIDDAEQMENLLLVKDVLRNGSLILVTSRDRDLLAHFQINIFYDVKLLNLNDAQELFCQHAFHHPKPFHDFQDLVQELVNMCGGFPLALKVLGGQLSGNRDRRYWMRQIENLQAQMPDNILQRVLRVSFNSLDPKDKEAFLDIAHFLVGEDKDLAVRVLEGLGGLDCLDTLHRKCLVEFENADVDFQVQRRAYMQDPQPFDIEIWRRPKGSFKIKMHNLVRELARQIGRERSPLRLCCSNDKMIPKGFHQLPYNVRGIRRDEDHKMHELPFFLLKQDIYGLNLLALQHSMILRQFNGLSGDLVWLRMRNFNSEHILSSRLSLRDLRVLELTNVNIEDIGSLSYDGELPSQLREVTVACTDTSHLFAFNSPSSRRRRDLPSSSGIDKSSTNESSSNPTFPPNVFGKWLAVDRFQVWLGKLDLKNLGKIVLKNIPGMQSLPIKFEEIRNLQHLDLSGCSDLVELPHSFTQLSQLQYLALRDCKKLLLPDLGEISTLLYLDLGGCRSLNQLPRGTIDQRSLRYLNVLDTCLKELPENLELLENLEQLYIGSHVLRSLPSSLKNMGRLTDLAMVGCSNLYSISNSIIQLVNLERLRICSSGVKSLPKQIVWTNIKVIDVQHCPSYYDFTIGMNAHEMPLDSFQMQGSECVGEVAMKDAHRNRISCLTTFIVNYSRIYKVCIPPAGSLFPNLEIVDLSNCTFLGEIASLPGNLIKLNLRDCPELRTLTCLSNLTSLKFMNISGCERLEGLNVEGLSSMEVMKAEKCWKLQSIEGLGQLQKLSEIQISIGNSISSSTWRDILAFPSTISTAIMCGASVSAEVVDELDGIVHSLQHVTIIDVSPLSLEKESPLEVKLDDASFKGAILLCLVADKYAKFQVTLLGNAYTSSTRLMDDGDVYRTHMFVWTQDSEVFKEFKHCGDESAYCKIQLLNALKNKEYTKAGLKKGWIVTAKNLEFCKQLLNFSPRVVT